MKNIVIIEDTFDHFQITGKLVADSDSDVFPKNITSGQILSDFLTPVKAFIDTTDATIRSERIKEFFECEKMKSEGNKISVSAYIVDYQLLADTNRINGLKFCEYIEDIREGRVPVILLTILDLDDVDVISKKNEFTIKFPKSRIEFERKVQNKKYKRTRNWDEPKKTLEEIIENSSDLGTRLKNMIKRLCENHKTEEQKEDTRNGKYRELSEVYDND